MSSEHYGMTIALPSVCVGWLKYISWYIKALGMGGFPLVHNLRVNVTVAQAGSSICQGTLGHFHERGFQTIARFLRWVGWGVKQLS